NRASVIAHGKKTDRRVGADADIAGRNHAAGGRRGAAIAECRAAVGAEIGGIKPDAGRTSDPGGVRHREALAPRIPVDAVIAGDAQPATIGIYVAADGESIRGRALPDGSIA